MRKPNWSMSWGINKHRKDRRRGAISPVPASRYYRELSKQGAGWDELGRRTDLRI